MDRIVVRQIRHLRGFCAAELRGQWSIQLSDLYVLWNTELGPDAGHDLEALPVSFLH